MIAMAWVDAVSTDKLKDLLICPICFETVNEPRTLPCFHSYCKCCLEKFVKIQRDKGVGLNCANCRTEFTLAEEGVEGMIQNYFILSMLDIMVVQNQVKAIACAHQCSKASVGRCVTCELFLCKECIEAHNSYKANRGHSVLSMDELSKPENREKLKVKGKGRCRKHKGKMLELYCETCEEIICLFCMNFDHLRPDHECLPLETVAEKKKKLLEGNSKVLDEMLYEAKETVQELQKHSRALENNMEETEEEIKEHKDRIVEAIEKALNEKSQALIKDARDIFHQKQKAINKQIEQVIAYGGKVKGTADMSRNVLDSGSEEQIVSSQKDIQDNVERLQTECPKVKLNELEDGIYDVDKVHAIFMAEIERNLQDNVQGEKLQ